MAAAASGTMISCRSSTKPPPSTMQSGLTKLTRLAMTTPTMRERLRMSSSIFSSPRRTASARAADLMFMRSAPACLKRLGAQCLAAKEAAWAAMALRLATSSSRPWRSEPESGPCASMRKCPISPARPELPR